MNSFINDIFEKLAQESLRLALYNKKPTITSREIQTTVRLVLPGELAKHAVSKRTKAVSKITDPSVSLVRPRRRSQHPAALQRAFAFSGVFHSQNCEKGGLIEQIVPHNGFAHGKRWGVRKAGRKRQGIRGDLGLVKGRGENVSVGDLDADLEKYHSESMQTE
ncbi:hypothetical protein Fmac_022156 [Flemingia macrophylla]|uniref:Core Histone H2A/H2B/H3 domain-containing protein n=1 Tax=Flemingia macrophylla TaxID=520843 RepID=A0ABD1LYW9_9FABA